MKTETGVLIVLVIFLLSVGPLYMFLGEDAAEIPYDDSDYGEDFIISLSGNITGEIIEVRPYISYVGVAMKNDDSFVHEEMSRINYTDEYTVDVSLNPSGNGFRFEIFIPLENESDAARIGFLTKFALDYYFTESYTTTLGYIKIPESFEAGGRTVRSDNKTALSVLRYSQKKGSIIQVSCGEFMVTNAGDMISSPAICVDSSQGLRHGLQIEDILLNSRSENLTLELEIIEVSSPQIQGVFTGMALNTTELQMEFGEFAMVSNPSDGEEGAVIVFMSEDNASKAFEIAEALRSRGVEEVEVFKVGTARMPENVELSDGVKTLRRFPFAYFKLGNEESAGVKEFDVLFSVLYGVVEDITTNLG